MPAAYQVRRAGKLFVYRSWVACGQERKSPGKLPNSVRLTPLERFRNLFDSASFQTGKLQVLARVRSLTADSMGKRMPLPARQRCTVPHYGEDSQAHPKPGGQDCPQVDPWLVKSCGGLIRNTVHQQHVHPSRPEAYGFGKKRIVQSRTVWRTIPPASKYSFLVSGVCTRSGAG